MNDAVIFSRCLEQAFKALAGVTWMDELLVLTVTSVGPSVVLCFLQLTCWTAHPWLGLDSCWQRSQTENGPGL